METVQKTVTLPKAASDLADGLTALTAAVQAALKDGFQVGQDLPAIISAAVTDLVKPMAEIQALPEEAKQDGVGVAEAFVIAGTEYARSLKAAQ